MSEEHIKLQLSKEQGLIEVAQRLLKGFTITKVLKHQCGNANA